MATTANTPGLAGTLRHGALDLVSAAAFLGIWLLRDHFEYDTLRALLFWPVVFELALAVADGFDEEGNLFEIAGIDEPFSGLRWGFGPDGEMNNMWKRTAQPGLWFVGGSFANCRTYSRYVGLQIKAIDEGLLSKH